MPSPPKKSGPRQRRTSAKRAPVRRPGRPRNEQASEAVRRQLLERAREQFAQHGYAGVSLRHLAAEVGVNPAMVHYYFGNKQGLFLAMLAEHVEPLLTRLEQSLEDTHTEGRQTLTSFLGVFTDTLRREAWLPGLVLREVLPPQGALHQVFTERFARRGGGMLRALIVREQQQGKLPAGLDPSLTTLTLISQVWFPFLARPLATQVFDAQFDTGFPKSLVRHILATLYGDARFSAAPHRSRADTKPDPP